MKKKIILLSSIVSLGIALTSCGANNYLSKNFNVVVPERKEKAEKIEDENEFASLVVDFLDENGVYADTINSLFDNYKGIMIANNTEIIDHGYTTRADIKSIYEFEARRLYSYCHTWHINGTKEIEFEVEKEANLEYLDGEYYIYLNMSIHNGEYYQYENGMNKTYYDVNGSASLTFNYSESKIATEDSLKKSIKDYFRAQVDFNFATTGFDVNAYVLPENKYEYLTYDMSSGDNYAKYIQIVENKLRTYSMLEVKSSDYHRLMKVQNTYLKNNVLGNINKNGYKTYDFYNYGISNFVYLPYNVENNKTYESIGSDRFLTDNFTVTKRS